MRIFKKPEFHVPLELTAISEYYRVFQSLSIDQSLIIDILSLVEIDAKRANQTLFIYFSALGGTR